MSKLTKLLATLTLSFIFVLFVSFVGKAQSSTATLSGTVVDANGATVPGASVTLSNTATGFERKIVTSDEGSFFIPLLQPANYTLTVAREGFASAQVENVILNVGDQKALRVELKVSPIKDEVIVTPDAALVNTDAKVGIVVNRDFIERSPIQGRSFQALIGLTPGVVFVDANGPNQGGQFSVNGQRQSANAFMVDGVTGNISAPPPGSGLTAAAGGNLPALSLLGTTHPMAGMEELQEFAVQTSTYGAEYGRQPGGQISISTRSGTNDLHGAIFDYVRNEKFDANDWFANSLGAERTVFRQNQFGGTINGPVFLPNFGDGGPRWYNGRNRTFFFFNYEGLRLVLPEFEVTDVPSMCLRGLGGASCTVAPAHALVLPVLRAFPVPNGPEGRLPNGQPSGWAQLFSSVSTRSKLDAASIRIDHSIGEKASAFLRFNRTQSSSLGRNVRQPVQINSQSNVTRNLTSGLTSLISSSLSNDLRFNWSTAEGTSKSAQDDFGGAVPVDRTVVFPAAIDIGEAGAIVSFSFPGHRTNTTSARLASLNPIGRQRQFNITDTVSFVKGAHQLKFGLDYRRLAPTLRASESLSISFSTLTQVQTATAGTLSWSANYMAEPRYTYFSAFGQDTWKTTKRLTLTLGLRWDFSPPPSEANGKSPLAVDQIDDLATMRLEPIGTKPWRATYLNFAPRFGVAYQVTDGAGSETVVRGGFGVYYDTGNETSSVPFIAAFPFLFSQQFTGAALRLPIDPALIVRPAVPIDGTFPARIPTTYVFDPELELPYTLQWNLSAERSFGKAQSLTVSYVGAAGRKLLQQNQRNITSMNPGFSTVRIMRNNATSDYHALQANFQRRLSKGFMAIASYTWAHTIDDASQGDALRVPRRGNALFDIRHVFAGAASYDLPKPKFGGPLGWLLRDWSVDTRLQIQSAAPLEVFAGSFTDPATGDIVNVRPNVIPGVPFYIFDEQYPGGRTLNNTAYTAADNAMLLAAGCLRVARGPSDPVGTPTGAARGAWCTPPAGQDGNLGRNQLRGLPMWQVDVSLRREFHILERVRVQLRGDAFNIINHPNFGSISTGLTTANFGKAQNMTNRQLRGIDSLFQIGGPRSLQFSARISF